MVSLLLRTTIKQTNTKTNTNKQTQQKLQGDKKIHSMYICIDMKYMEGNITNLYTASFHVRIYQLLKLVHNNSEIQLTMYGYWTQFILWSLMLRVYSSNFTVYVLFFQT